MLRKIWSFLRWNIAKYKENELKKEGKIERGFIYG